MKRIKVSDTVDIDADSVFTGLFEDVAKQLLLQKSELEAKGWSKLTLQMEYYQDFAELVVHGYRDETDAEYNKRLKFNEEQDLKAKQKEERERKKYEELKAKFEKL